jgi:hypothetical protein
MRRHGFPDIALRSRLRFLLLALFLLPAPAGASAYKVPADYPTIAEGIAAAGSGDTVLVAAGVYPEAVSIAQSLVLLGGWDTGFRIRDPRRFESVIDGATTGRPVVTIHGEAGESVVLDGLTVRNGWLAEGNGGGVLVLGNVYAVIRDSVIRGNYARYHGGGVCYFLGASGRVEGNLFEGNSAVFHGAALCALDRVRLEVLRNTFIGNRVVLDSGAGVAALRKCVLTVMANRFEGNVAMKRGAAVSLLDEIDGLVARNLIVANDCGYMGGALYTWKSTARIEENTLVRNTSPVTGGIRVDERGSARIVRNLVVRSPGPWAMTEGKASLDAEGNVIYACAAAEGAPRAPLVLGARLADPLLCDEGEDQRLRPASPLLQGGRAGCYAVQCDEAPGRDEPPLRAPSP